MKGRIKRKHEGPVSIPGMIKSRDLESMGISRHKIPGMLRRGELERLGWGLYRKTSVEATEYETVAMVSAKIPNGIICLLSALQIHDIGTQSPREIWIAIDVKARLPRLNRMPVRIVRFSKKMFKYGVIEKKYQGVTVKVTTPARTVVDCFRYRNKIGLDVALEALRDALRRKIATVDEIVRAAEMCRAITVIRPYLDSIES
jgi:predicted transcriptional regulator of viral defense system